MKYLYVYPRWLIDHPFPLLVADTQVGLVSADEFRAKLERPDCNRAMGVRKVRPWSMGIGGTTPLIIVNN